MNARTCIKCHVCLPIEAFRTRYLKNGNTISENTLTTCRGCERLMANKRRFAEKIQKKLNANLAEKVEK